MPVASVHNRRQLRVAFTLEKNAQTKNVKLAGITAAALVMLSACGNSDADTAGEDGITEITVGAIPILM